LKRFLGVGVATLIFCHASMAGASPITVSYSGTVDSVAANLSSYFSIGDLLSGTFVLDDGVPPDLGNAPGAAMYVSPNQPYTATIGSHGFGGNGVVSYGFTTTPAIDTYMFLGFGTPNTYLSTLTGSSLGTFAPTLFQWVLSDSTGTAVDSLLPAGPLLSAYDTRAFVLGFDGPDGHGAVFGEINSADFAHVAAAATPTPEPATMLLFGSGIVGVAARMKARRAK
jgi:hypothetical protein